MFMGLNSFACLCCKILSNNSGFASIFSFGFNHLCKFQIYGGLSIYLHALWSKINKQCNFVLFSFD